MPAISRTCRGHGPLLQKIADHQSEQIYDNHYNSEDSFFGIEEVFFVSRF
jgi:hypothetical protein